MPSSQSPVLSPVSRSRTQRNVTFVAPSPVLSPSSLVTYPRSPTLSPTFCSRPSLPLVSPPVSFSPVSRSRTLSLVRQPSPLTKTHSDTPNPALTPPRPSWSPDRLRQVPPPIQGVPVRRQPDRSLVHRGPGSRLGGPREREVVTLPTAPTRQVPRVPRVGPPTSPPPPVGAKEWEGAGSGVVTPTSRTERSPVGLEIGRDRTKTQGQGSQVVENLWRRGLWVPQRVSKTRRDEGDVPSGLRAGSTRGWRIVGGPEEGPEDRRVVRRKVGGTSPVPRGVSCFGVGKVSDCSGRA